MRAAEHGRSPLGARLVAAVPQGHWQTTTFVAGLRPTGVMLFAKLKALLRKAAARTRDELWSTIGRILATIPPAECANYLDHSGYGCGST